MNALTHVFPVRGIILVLWLDSRGLLPTRTRIPCEDMARWRKFDGAKLAELLKTANPTKPILSCEWADPAPFRFDVADLVPDVVLVKVAGNIGRPLGVAKSSAEKYRRKPKREEEEHWNAGSPSTYADRLWDAHRDGRVSVPAPAAVEPGPKCGCGIGHTLASYRALPMLDAKERTEGFTVILDESRTCACGEALHFTSKRLLAEKR